ncbi:MAG TPA: PH domain-containing protein [Actinomycetota bacterium]
MHLPRSARLASPAFDGSSRWAIGLGAACGIAAAVLIPGAGWFLGALCVVAGWLASRRRRTIGAYEGVDGLVVRNWFATHEIAWREVERVEQRRDPWLPFLRVAVLRHGAGASLPISGLRHGTRATPAPVLTLTKLVRDTREARSRDTWTI